MSILQWCFNIMAGALQLDTPLDDALGADLQSAVKNWTLTPATPRLTHTPTVDQACFVDPSNFDCLCLLKIKRQCGYIRSSTLASLSPI